MSDEEYGRVVITPEAWSELYALLKPLLTGLGEWGLRHELPPSVVLGVTWGVASIIAEMSNTCDCPLCEATSEAISVELLTRMLEPMCAVKH